MDDRVVKDARVHAPMTWMKQEILVYFRDHSEFSTDQFKKILSKTIENEIKCFDFCSMKRELKSLMARVQTQNLMKFLKSS